MVNSGWCCTCSMHCLILHINTSYQYETQLESVPLIEPVYSLPSCYWNPLTIFATNFIMLGLPVCTSAQTKKNNQSYNSLTHAHTHIPIPLSHTHTHTHHLPLSTPLPDVVLLIQVSVLFNHLFPTREIDRRFQLKQERKNPYITHGFHTSCCGWHRRCSRHNSSNTGPARTTDRQQQWSPRWTKPQLHTTEITSFLWHREVYTLYTLRFIKLAIQLKLTNYLKNLL